jgi:HK97 gp10 family phage protein
MANDKLSIRLEGGVRLDRILSGMQQRIATRLVDQSLKKGAAELRKNVKKSTPKDTGQLKKSVKSGLRKKVNVGKDVFLGGVWFQQGANFGGADGYYARWVLKRHAKNAFGYRGGNNFLTPAVRSSKAKVRKIIGEQLADKIVKQEQQEINRAL